MMDEGNPGKRTRNDLDEDEYESYSSCESYSSFEDEEEDGDYQVATLSEYQHIKKIKLNHYALTFPALEYYREDSKAPAGIGKSQKQLRNRQETDGWDDEIGMTST